VSIAATDKTASELTPSDTGAFTISRTGNIASALTVKLSMGGTTRTQDYQLKDGGTVLSGLNPTVVLAANQTSKILTVIAVPNGIYTGTQWVIANLATDASYSINPAQNSGIVALADKDGCQANVDQSAVAPVLNVNDYVRFLNLFAALNPIADFDFNGQLNANDFQAYQNKFAAGCL
jgi:hypothetical protein